jgi:hypothetical protein
MLCRPREGRPWERGHRRASTVFWKAPVDLGPAPIFSISCRSTKILELFDCDFIEERRNLVLIGPTGVGKTHLLSALGVAACTRGYRVLFSTAAELLMSLIAAKREDRLRQRLATIDRYDILLIDELGYIPFEREATDLLFQVIARCRYGVNSSRPLPSGKFSCKRAPASNSLRYVSWINCGPSPNVLHSNP